MHPSITPKFKRAAPLQSTYTDSFLQEGIHVSQPNDLNQKNQNKVIE